jgi:hypothetical protein
MTSRSSVLHPRRTCIYEAEYSPVAVDGDTVVATGTSRYRELPGGPVVRTYECFVRRFDGEGCCREFTEYYLPAHQRHGHRAFGTGR